MKRAFDIAVASIMLIALSPIMLVVALLIYAQDRGPVLFLQPRVGRGGEVFRIYKFRSMVLNAERLGGYSTGAYDPRITRIGRFVRRSSIDELPQLLNVVLGHMSIVGPRPDVPQQEALYDPAAWRLRTSVRPGITGLAQATLRSAATPEKRLAADLHYVRSASLWLDLKIVAMTFRSLFSSTGKN